MPGKRRKKVSLQENKGGKDPSCCQSPPSSPLLRDEALPPSFLAVSSRQDPYRASSPPSTYNHPFVRIRREAPIAHVSSLFSGCVIISKFSLADVAAAAPSPTPVPPKASVCGRSPHQKCSLPPSAQTPFFSSSALNPNILLPSPRASEGGPALPSPPMFSPPLASHGRKGGRGGTE